MVLNRVDEIRCLMKTIWVRKKNWIGHVMRVEGLLRDVLEGRMLGNARQGRSREKLLDDLMKEACVYGRKNKEEEKNILVTKN